MVYMKNYIIDQIFKYHYMNTNKLLKYGFVIKEGDFVYKTKLMNSTFELNVLVTKENIIETKLIEQELMEEYTLHLVEGALGEFVGRVREEYINILKDICTSCFELNVFSSNQAKELIKFIKELYGDELEFLWEKFKDTAIWRRKDNQKWYGTIMNISKRKLGVDSDEMVTIVNVRFPAEKLDDIIDNQTYFKAYHMNKKHWVSIVLETLSFSDLKKRIEESYFLTK